MAIQLQEFAKQVLFGTTMEEKLSCPREKIVDTHPGNAIKTPANLPRPKHLVLRENGERVAPPGNAKLIDEKERGRLLHFFGNHELLATELMALALLKFPDAPASFRHGVLETLKEEQIHTKLYIHRMKQCGVEFGELRLSDYFWKSVSSMEDPLDYVTRLSLTFEQANLDYSREYAKLFQMVGDDSTAGILDKIYRDEIAHVGFGLKWFRRWKAVGKTDWEAFRERLVFPLSPARAKGNCFNTEGRSEAGFDEAFISDLQLFQQSRGRTPSIYWFNPEAEKFVGQNSPDGLEDAPSILQKDLGFLSAYLSRRDDLLVLPGMPTPAFLRQIQSYGFSIPEIILSDAASRAPIVDRKIGAIRPWAWSPDSICFFENTFERLTCKVNLDTLWNEDFRRLYSKAWSADWGRKLAIRHVDDDWCAPTEVYGKEVFNLDELVAIRKDLASRGYANIVCKAPFGTAANGNRCIMEGEEISSSTETWLEGIWKIQSSVLVEPWLDRVFDFSVQFEKREEGLKILAFTRLINNQRGQFRGIVTNAFCNGLDEVLVRFLMARINRRPRVYAWYENELLPQMEPFLDKPGFKGALGVDAFVYRDPSGVLKLKSVVEINPRYTMGRIAHELSQHTVSGTVGFFQIVSKSQIRRFFGQTFAEYADTLKKEQAAVLSKDPRPRIASGSFPLNDPSQPKQFLALFHVRKNFAQVQELVRQF